MVDRQKTLVVDGGAARIAELEAENERLVKELQTRAFTNDEVETIRSEAHEVAERAGGVKVRALEDAMRRAMEIYQADEVHDVGEEMFMELHRALRGDAS